MIEIQATEIQTTTLYSYELPEEISEFLDEEFLYHELEEYLNDNSDVEFHWYKTEDEEYYFEKDRKRGRWPALYVEIPAAVDTPELHVFLKGGIDHFIEEQKSYN